MHFDDICFLKKSQEIIIVLSEGMPLNASNVGLKEFFDRIKILEGDGYAFSRPLGSRDIFARVECFASDVEMHYVCEEIKEISAAYGCKCTIAFIK